MPSRRTREVVNRRQFLGRAGMLAGAVALGPSLLAACGGDDDDSSSGSKGDTGGANLGGGGDPKRLVISNWPLYIDPTEKGTTGTVDLFRKATGINLSYHEDFNDNNDFFAKIQPDLQAGKKLPQDIIVPSSWLTARLIKLGWLDTLPFDEIPNKKNLRSDLQHGSWDPDGLYSLPWQTGISGIAYNIKAAGRELKTMDDLLDPKFKGKIGMLTEMRDTVGLYMLNTGADPSKPTYDAAQPAFEKIEKAKNAGQIRQFTGNDYQDDLVAGNFVACIGWSGDIAQLALDEPNLRFAVPEEGGMRWQDTMVMPKGAVNRTAAATWMNYCYDPVNAARIEAYIGYWSPVNGVREELAKNPDKDVAVLADSELMFPTDETLKQTHLFGDLSEEEETKFDERFAEITGG
jgi:spermidine/putrescine transport system substrate-binding protein